jgi:hypothetical protein
LRKSLYFIQICLIIIVIYVFHYSNDVIPCPGIGCDGYLGMEQIFINCVIIMLLEVDERDLAYREVHKATVEARKERKKEKKAKINPKDKIPKINTEMKKECGIFFFF